jgi:16S rRNA (adenine1518-N6/adenine1519-N6)-dimethyltransferase
VQKEVAERIVARDKKESILSFSVKAYGEPRYVSTVKRGSFTPSPNVDSAILHVGGISKKFFTDNNIKEETYFAVLKAAFAHKRKIISRNLEDKGFAMPDMVDRKARAEDLALSDFAAIARVNTVS